jgi:hypothetical protein
MGESPYRIAQPPPAPEPRPPFPLAKALIIVAVLWAVGLYVAACVYSPLGTAYVTSCAISVPLLGRVKERFKIERDRCARMS